MPEAFAKEIRPGHADARQAIIDFLPSGVNLFDPDLHACNEQLKRLLDFPAAMFERGLPTMYELAIYHARRGDYRPGDREVLAHNRWWNGRAACRRCCRTAAFTGERVIVDDIVTHPCLKPTPVNCPAIK